MSDGKSSFHTNFIKAIFAGIFIAALSSCGVVPKNYPKNKPFVYEYKINIDGNFLREQKTELVSRLANQLDDSIHIRTVRKVIYKGINRAVVNKPPLYDSNNAYKSVLFMKTLLNSLGYFRKSITYDTTVKIVDKDQYRTTVSFNVKPGKAVTLDSISYNIKQPELQSLTLANSKESYLKKGEPFAQSAILNELNRLVDLYRNNGYLRFSNSELQGYWDTLDISLLQPSLDPFEQIEMSQKLKNRRENPKANLEIRLKPGSDNSKLIKYFVGNVNVYPDFDQDTVGHPRKEVIVDSVKVIYYRNLVKPKILPQNIYLHHGDLYRQEKYLKTINRFNSLGTWRLINIEQKTRSGQDSVDLTIRLSPAKKYSFTTNIEATRNQSTVSGSLFGLALNVGTQNRNLAKSAIQTNTNVRFGIEFGSNKGDKFIETQQVILSHNIYFPRPIPNSKWIPAKVRENFRTILSFNLANTDRKDLYNLATVNAAWGYEFQLGKKFFTLRIPSIEFSNLNPRPELDTLFKYNPSLRNIFTDGFVSSIIGGFSVNGGRNKNLNVFRANIEESGLLTGLLHNKFLDTNLYRFIRTDVEFTRKIQYKKSSIILRFFTGVGYELTSTVNPEKRNNLPFFKQYFAGGTNSMRAWGLRKLGPGSIIKEFTGSNGIPDRYGDVQLEANLEYRFLLFNISGVKLEGAVFTDIGNVWLLKKQPGPPEAYFNFSRLGKDIAVGAGTGLRVDFSFFVIRFDYSYKVKDPSPSPDKAASQNKWFYDWKLFNGQFQLGIGYPFIL